jgi:tetratricopeptide (TPR) repeat protein
VGQLLEAGLQRLKRKGPQPADWAGMEMFLERQIPASDPRMATVYAHFKQNLADILRVGAKHGVKIVVSSVVSNLKDCAPFGSQHALNLSPADKAEWEKLYKAGIEWEATNQFTQALAAFQKAAQIGLDYAELQYRLGRCYLGAGKFDLARQKFEQARDLDTLRFRTDSRLNQIIRELTAHRAQEGIYFVDAAEEFARRSPNQIVGEELLCEHVHFTFDGNYQLAELVAGQIEKILAAHEQKATQPVWLAPYECARRLAYTDWNRLRVLEGVRARLRKPPFQWQINAGERDKRLQRQLASLKPATQPAALPQWIELYRQALAHAPGDWELHNQFGRLLEAFGKTAEAAKEYRTVIQIMPQFAVGYYQLGALMNREGNQTEAIRLMTKALAIIPYFPEALNSLGIALAHQGKFPEAIQSFAKALQLRPDYDEAEVNWGMTLGAQGKITEAILHYQNALRLNSNSAPAHLNLARLLVQQRSDTYEPVAHFAAAFRLQSLAATNHYNLGNTAFAKGNRAEALARYAEAIRLNPNYAEAHYKLGLTWTRYGRLRNAEAQFREALRCNPDFALAHFDLGVALGQQSKFSEAIDHFRETMRLEPTNQVAKEYLEKAEQFQRQQGQPTESPK